MKVFEDSLKVCNQEYVDLYRIVCGVDGHRDEVHHMQRQIDELAKLLPLQSPSSAVWQEHRRQAVEWLRSCCALHTMQPAADEVVKVSETDGVATEQILLGVDRDFRCPAVLVRPAGTGTTQYTAIVLSHGDRQSAASAKIAEAARRLAVAGLWVIVPDHASVEPHSLQPLDSASKPRFRGDEAVNFYGPAEAVKLPPLRGGHVSFHSDSAPIRRSGGPPCPATSSTLQREGIESLISRRTRWCGGKSSSCPHLGLYPKSKSPLMNSAVA